MSLLKEYTEADLKKLFSGLIRKPITDRMMDVLIAHTYNRNPNNRSSGFYYPGGLDAILTWDDINRIFSLEPVIPDVDVYDKNGDLYVPHFRFYSWYQGPVLHRIYEKMELELPDEEGLYMIFFGVDQEEREWVLQFIKNPEAAEIAETYTTGVIVAWIYWHENNSALYVGDSRHGSEWNPAFHWTWHQTLNSQRQSGLTFENMVFDGDGSEDEHYQFGISAGKIWHDDIYAETEAVGALNALPVWHFLSGLPRIISQPNKKFLTHGSGRLAFHTGALFQEAQDGWFVAYHYFATNCKKEPIIAAVANAEHETLAAAVGSIAADLERVKSQLPHKQLLHIGSIIYQTSDEYENSAKTRIVWSTGTVDTFVTELEFDDNTRTLTLRQNNNKEDLIVIIPGGDGEGGGGDAREIELDIISGWVVWRYVGDANWQQLFKIPADGADGREIQLRTNAGYVEWKYDDEISWTQLFKIPVDGSDGKEIELRENAGYVEWRYVGIATWTQLYLIPTGGGGGSDAPELHLDFEEAGDEFVYNVPYNMKFTSMVSEGSGASLDVALNTVMARYDRLTITATAAGLVSLYGVYV